MSARTARTTRQVPGENWPEGQGHPSAAVLRAYQREELPADEAERLWDYFVLCPECTQTMLDLTVFFAGAPTPGRQNPDEVLATWDDLVKTLEPSAR